MSVTPLPLLVISVVGVLLGRVGCDVYHAQVELESMFQLRQVVSAAVAQYLEKEEARLSLVRDRYLISTGLQLPSTPTSLDAPEDANPITSFLSIKALYDLGDILVPALDRSNLKELALIMEGLLGSGQQAFPGATDLKGAAMGIIRLQKTYKLPTQSLSKGCLTAELCTTELSVDDCFELGKQSYLERDYENAINWLEEAERKFDVQIQSQSQIRSHLNSNENNGTITELLLEKADTAAAVSKTPRRKSKTDRAKIRNYLSWSMDIRNSMSLGKQFLSELTGFELDAFVDEVVKAAENEPKDAVDKYSTVLEKYEALCRGEGKERASHNPALTCRYSRMRAQHYNPLYLIQEELLHEDPPIWMFHNVLYEGEIEVIKRKATPHFETAKVVNAMTGGEMQSNVRVSKSAWLIDEDDPVVAKVNRRIQHLTNLEVENAEDLQVANYGLGGYYLPHLDFSHTAETIRFLSKDEGNRIATLMFYMSNVKLGGATAFPHLALSVAPEKGAAVFWYNLKKNGDGDYRTQHGACPVLVGDKWVSNKWIQERGQEFNRPCGLEYDN